MNLTAGLAADRREHVEARLRGNLMAWLTTVRPDGQPRTVPVWFLIRDDDTILIYSRPGKAKLTNLASNPHVTLALDVSDLGRDVITIDGTAKVVTDQPPANEVPAYVAKYAERIGALFETPERFASMFDTAVVVTPTRLRA
ncbi:TIGR03667 family PPOX class F420-dependent oxidoreductase [Fodinicola acaciae]|uniref:TIGR03667 family PPOX class F420-dependent oxidoreductase n=1 Tax=Fodinicola acaciae TaxID=2681555 RepID=UPI0013D15A2A|nr:TIGR03667 family PPOX class F420-dependent oxidoreductase [Fodinicola acaciae]